MSKLDKPMNKKRLQSIIDSENMKGSVYVSTEVCASYSMKADPDRNTTANWLQDTTPSISSARRSRLLSRSTTPWSMRPAH